MSNLLKKAKSSKLRDNLSQQDNGSAISNKKKTEYPRSYRLDAEIMNVLKDTLDRINSISNKKISEARLVKALIFLSRKMDEQAIIKASKEVW